MASRAVSLTIRIAVAAAVIGGIAWWLASRNRSAPTGTQTSGADGRVISVKVVAAAREDVPVWREGLGAVAAYQQVTVRSQVDGRLDAVKFIEGQHVKAGDDLAQIDPRPFEAQRLSAEGALRRDSSQLDIARRQLARNKNMREQNLISDSTVEQFESQVGQLEGAVKIDQAQIKTAQLNLDYARIRAPLDGITGVRLVDAGNIVHAADTTGIVVITAIDPAAVFFTIAEDFLPEIVGALDRAKQNNVAVPVEIWNRDGTKRLGKDGHLAVIDNQINQTTATVRLKAFVTNDERVLWPNAFVKARVLVDTRAKALVVPVVAVQQGPNGAFVYIVDKDGLAQMKPIVVDIATPEVAVIAKGLDGGEQVVFEGQSQLRPGAKVQIVKDGAGSGRPDAATQPSPHKPASDGGKPGARASAP
jgi:multidrug efflux system membrane fusion protein